MCPKDMDAHILNDKQCKSRSVGFFRSQLIWIYTVCKKGISEFSRTRVNVECQGKEQLASTIFKDFGMTPPGFEPTTQSQSRMPYQMSHCAGQDTFSYLELRLLEPLFRILLRRKSIKLEGVLVQLPSM